MYTLLHLAGATHTNACEGSLLRNALLLDIGIHTTTADNGPQTS
jgi:hypothetical protein